MTFSKRTTATKQFIDYRLDRVTVIPSIFSLPQWTENHNKLSQR